MKIFFTLFLLFGILLGYFSNGDDTAININEQTFQRAMYTFAISKGLNGIISVLQSSEVNLSFFVGATVGLGQILDPINDLVERFSLVMLISTVAIEIHSLLILFGNSIYVKALLVIFGALSMLSLWLPQFFSRFIFFVALRLFLIAFMLRFLALAFVFSSDAVYESVYAKEYSNANSYIQIYKSDLETVQKNDNNLDNF